MNKQKLKCAEPVEARKEPRFPQTWDLQRFLSSKHHSFEPSDLSDTFRSTVSLSQGRASQEEELEEPHTPQTITLSGKAQDPTVNHGRML